MPCQAGFYGATRGQTSETCSGPCPPGSYSLSGASSCTECPPGTYGNGGSASQNCSGPVTCNAGYYALAGASSSSAFDQNTCAMCPSGTYSNAGSLNCTDCPGGYFGSAGGVTSSTCSGICQAGTYAFPGSSLCTDCPAGTYGSTQGLATSLCSGQVTCNSGKYAILRATSNDVNSPSTCLDCPAGTFGAAGSITSACSGSCLPGTYSLAGASVCLDCPAGSFGSGGGLTSSSCSGLCQPGEYSLAGSISCTLCPAGTYGSTQGLSTSACTGPVNCSVGMFALIGAKNNNIADLTTCANCPPGKYSLPGSTTCTDCPPGTYGTQGSTSPTCTGKCRPGTYGLGGSTSPLCTGSVTCSAGYYALAGAMSNQITDPSTCGVCPPGKFSLSGSVVCLECDAGTFGEAFSIQTSRSCSGVCLPGSYAFAGSTFCSPCPSGTYGNSSSTKSKLCAGFCNMGSYSTFGSVNCSLCSSNQYSFGGSGCSSCDPSIGSELISSFRGCSPSSTLVSGPSDTSFYLSGSQAEGVLAMSVGNSTSGISYVKNHLSAAFGALNLASRSYLTATPEVGSSMLASLSRSRESFSAGVWVKCSQPSGYYDAMTALSWGGPTTINILSTLLPGAPTPSVKSHQLNLGGKSFERFRVSVLAGNGPGSSDGEGTSASFNDPQGISIDSFGTVFIADTGNHCIRSISPTGVVSTLAGSGSGSSDGIGTNAQFNNPRDVAVGPSGTIYVADSSNDRIRVISSTGVVSTLAGSSQGFSDGVGTNALFSDPQGIAVGPSGKIYVADTGNHRIRIVTLDGAVITLAGRYSMGSYNDGIGTSASFDQPHGVSVDST